MLKIAIQGIQGSNHHIAAQQYFNDKLELIKCDNFNELIKSLQNHICDYAVMAIENSIAGSIIPNYELIRKSGLYIIGEHYVHIEHHLLATHTDISKIKKIYSHPMALLQCEVFFENKPGIQLIEYPDTALAAQMIVKENDPTIGALANGYAAEIFGNKIIKKDIQTIQNNQTRFVILSKEKAKQDNSNKASIWFTLNHESGSLAEILNIINNFDLNLTKIQSLPIIEKPWEYSFFVDILFQNIENYNNCISKIIETSNDFKILGEYRNKKND